MAILLGDVSPSLRAMEFSKSGKPLGKKIRKSSLAILLYGLLFSALLFSLSIFKPTFSDFLNHKVYDYLLLASPRSEGSLSPVVIVDIDERSLREYGQWPWPRYRVATLVEKLGGMGAWGIGLDVLFAEPDRTSLQAIQGELRHDFGIHLEFKGMPPHLRDSDQGFAEVLSKRAAVLGYQFLFDEEPGSDGCLLHPLEVNSLSSAEMEEPSGRFIRARSVACNLPMFSRAAGASGFFNISPDADGILRRVPLMIEYEGRLYPSLALATLMRAMPPTGILLKWGKSGPVSLSLNQTEIPLSPNGTMLIGFRGKGKTFDYISAADILSDRVPKNRIQGKISFVGTTASGMKELKSTPFDPVFPGVEVHATIVDNILKNNFRVRPQWAPGLESLLVLAFGLLSALILSRTGAGWSSLLLGTLAAGVWQGSALIFQSEGIFISPVSPLMVLAGNFSLLTFLKFWREEHKARERTRELAMVQEATIESLSSLVETRDPETGGHIKRTQTYVRTLAGRLKNHPRFREMLEEENIDLLCKSAPLHDIGKVGVSDRILLKPGKLTGPEFEEMKKHTVYGRDALQSAEKKLGKISFLRFAREIAYTHHEKWDGSGYPESLGGERIPVSGRLMALADAYDAMTSKRIYKSAISHEKAMEIILGEKERHFDPDVVDAFVESKEEFQEIARRYADS
ncbi:MAG: CHASE2 domain-containing protein [Deltaproteobacteria bacterium]|nr:CHASE2 domain-containing protein [Deltaproteobacteria bacterium]